MEGLSATEDIVIVPIEQDKIDELIEKYPYYVQDEVPDGTYGLDEAVPTVAVQQCLLLVTIFLKMLYTILQKPFLKTLTKLHMQRLN